MIDTLKEIITYTHRLGFFQLVKVESTDTTTTALSMASDKTGMLFTTFMQPVPDAKGVFGLHGLGLLDTILNIPEYKENANIVVNQEMRDGELTPTGITFSNAKNDFRNDYRFMSKAVVEQVLPPRPGPPKTYNWSVSIKPSVNDVQRLKFQSQAAGPDEKTFRAWVDNGNLYFAIGDHSTHTGEFVFASNVQAKAFTPREWPLSQVQSILNLPGDIVLEIGDDVAMGITVTSGLAVHKYIILSSTK